MQVEQIIKEVPQLSAEDLQLLYKAVLKQITIPLKIPRMIFDDWDDLEVDALYADSW
jgi:hypothetical protein